MSFTDDMPLEYLTEGSQNAHETFNDDMDVVNNGREYKFELGDNGSKGQVFYYDLVSGTAKLAKADNWTTSHVVGFLTQDGVSTDERRFRYVGKLERSGWSLTPYKRYYLSPTVAGGITDTKPSGLDKIVEVGFTGASDEILYIQIREYLEVGGQASYAAVVPDDYPTISEACAALSDGAVIFVKTCTINEVSDIIPKEGQTIIAEGGVEGDDIEGTVVNMGDYGIVIANTEVTMRGIYYKFIPTTDEKKIICSGDNIHIDKCVFDFSAGINNHEGMLVSGVSGARMSGVKIIGNSQSYTLLELDTVEHGIFRDFDISGGSTSFSHLVYIIDSSYCKFEDFYVHGITGSLANIFMIYELTSIGSPKLNYYHNIYIDGSIGINGEGMRVCSSGAVINNIYTINCKTALKIESDYVKVVDYRFENCLAGMLAESGYGNEFINGVISGATDGFVCVDATHGKICNLICEGSSNLDLNIGANAHIWSIANCSLGVAQINAERTKVINSIIATCAITGTAVYTRFDTNSFTTFTDNGSATKIGMDVHVTTIDPTVNDDVTLEYMAGVSYWYNSVSKILFQCDDNTNGAAVWTPMEEMAFTTDVTSPVTCIAGVQYDNIGAIGAVTYNLPACSRGARIRFVVMNAQNMAVTAQGGDVMQMDGTSSSAGGTCTSATLYSVIEFVGLDATNWVCTYSMGIWTLA
jgi:hypothetical protein